ncbi:Hypothetical protein NTJ_03490 [Nesidiocoris tenuis]|uniref:Peptidase S1 domain-containing protein n=1 Tax=Nesidiocoris tenuis TaxID=355587 RepID=A0ABN7AJZ9_9HEMI|nr:Hypothetical protein NTJ_03490 [Nesidiocoris tenuis]
MQSPDVAVVAVSVAKGEKWITKSSPSGRCYVNRSSNISAGPFPPLRLGGSGGPLFFRIFGNSVFGSEKAVFTPPAARGWRGPLGSALPPPARGPYPPASLRPPSLTPTCDPSCPLLPTPTYFFPS